jgi:hypothetical protein
MNSRFLIRNEGSTPGLERACISEKVCDSNEFGPRVAVLGQPFKYPRQTTHYDRAFLNDCGIFLHALSYPDRSFPKAKHGANRARTGRLRFPASRNSLHW